MRTDAGPRTPGGWWARVWGAPRASLVCSVLLAPLALAACGGAGARVAAPTAQPSGPLASDSATGTIRVLAAASLGDVLDDLGTAWLAGHPGLELETTLGASNVLAAQIVEGAQADVFLSADRQRPTELAQAGLAAAEPVVFARNRLAIVAAADDERVTQATDIARPGVRLVAAGPGVPITRYADELVAQLAATTPDPAAFQQAVVANVVSREDNVRAALAKVELGEGDAAIVYTTDALSTDRVRVVPLPETVDVTAEYAAVAITDGAAADFVEWLRGPEAARILAAAGFGPVPA